MVHIVRMIAFFGCVGLGLWGLAVLPGPWGWIALVVAFVIAGVASMLIFKRLATHEQIKADLEARLHYD